MATKAPELTAEELATAQDEVTRERAVANRAEADRQAEALRLKNERQQALSDARARAAAVISAREALVPELVSTLVRVTEIIGKLRTNRAIFDMQGKHAVANGGTLITGYPKAFAIDPQERQLLRDTIAALQSVGGSV